MGVRSKTLITILLLGSVIGVMSLQVQNEELFQGNIELNKEIEEPNNQNPNQIPDLSVEIKVDPPEEGNEDIILTATIKNEGTGAVVTEKGLKYTIFVNEIDVLTNTDSFTTIEPGDSFSFTYSVPCKIYDYDNSGTVRFVVDTDDVISETNKENNQAAVDYQFDQVLNCRAN